LRFNEKDVSAFRQHLTAKRAPGVGRGKTPRRRKQWQSVIDADGLARIVYALQVKREDKACKWLLQWESCNLWRLAETGQHSASTDKQRALWQRQVEGIIRTAFPPLSAVPHDLLKWARDTARQLTPAEVDYIAAMFIVVAHPWSEFTQAETAAFRQVISASGHGRKRPPLSPGEIGRIAAQFKPGAWRDFTAEQKQRAIAALSQPTVEIDELLMAYESGDTVALGALVEDRMNSAGVFQRAPYAHLRVKSKTGEDEDETEDSAPDGLIDSSWKYAKDRKRETQGKPSGAKVARLLGIHRYQGTRIVRNLKEKLGRGGVKALFTLLDCSVPRTWKAAKTAHVSPEIRNARRAACELTCDACGAVVSDTAQTCPDCGALL